MVLDAETRHEIRRGDKPVRNDIIGMAYIKDAGIIALEAQDSLAKGHYHRTVRKSQEAVELALKGLLRFIGIEYPKSHKVGTVLLESSLKEGVSYDDLKKAAEISDELARERELSFYGTESDSAEDLFTEDDAKESLEMLSFIMDFVNKLIKKNTND